MWTSGRYKCYLYIRADEAIGITERRASALGSESEDPDAHPTTANDKKRDSAMGEARRLVKKRTKAGRPPTITSDLARDRKAPSEPSESQPLLKHPL